MKNIRLAKKDGDFPQDLTKRQIIEKHKGRIYSFSDLPLTAQLSIAYYMGIDGEAWFRVDDLGLLDKSIRYIVRRGLKSKMDAIVARYGTMEFGYVILSVETIREFWKYDDFPDIDSWYQETGGHKKPDLACHIKLL